MAKPRNKYLVTWDKHTVIVHQYSIRGAIGCAYRNRMTDKFPTTPAAVTSYEDFKRESEVIEVTPKIGTTIPLISRTSGHTGYFEIFNVIDNSGRLVCRFVGPYIRKGESINDNRNKLYNSYFAIAESEFPHFDIVIIAPTNPRIIIMNTGPISDRDVKKLAQFLLG